MFIKTTKINVDALKHLERFINSPSNPKFFFTMTEINKVGINPQSSYSTPLGIYAYPLIAEYYVKLVNNSLPFASGQPYINLFTLNVPTFNIGTYSEIDLKKDTDKLRLIYNIELPESLKPPDQTILTEVSDNKSIGNHIIEKAFREAKHGGTTIAKFWNLTRLLSGNAKNWNHLLRKLGYTNFYDPDTGLIHPGEPTQVVILDPTTIIVVETFYNPHVSNFSLPHISSVEKKMLEQKQEQESNKHKKIEKITNPNVLDRLARHYINRPDLFKSIITNNNTSADTLRFIFHNILNKPELEYNLSYFTFNDNTPSDILEGLLDRNAFFAYGSSLFQIMNHPNMSVDLLKSFAKNISWQIRRGVANSFKVTPEILHELSNDDHLEVKMDVANNEKTDPKTLDNLSKEWSFLILKGVAVNKNTMPETLRYLARPEILKNHIVNKNELTSHIASNINTPTDLLVQISNDPNISPETISNLALNTKLPTENLDLLATKNWNDIYNIILLARNPNISSKIMNLLSDHNDFLVRERLAYNPNISKEILEKLINDKNWEVRMVAMQNLRKRPGSKIALTHNYEKNMTHIIQKISKKNDEEKIPFAQIKKLPYKSLNRMIKKMREYLKTNEVVQKMFKEYKVDLSEIDLIPIMFGNLEVSAKTDHGVIILNYKLLTDGDFFKDFSYGVHEITHWLQRTTGEKATQSSDDGDYLDNPYEREGFANQVEYIAEQFGDGEAEQYVDDLLEHHEVESPKEIKEKKEALMSKV